MTFEDKRAKGIELVKRVHDGQTRADGSVPAWYHLVRVSATLQTVLGETGEGAPEEREIIALAALAHDSIEDTEVTREELVEHFGERGLALVEGMTNRFGDDHPAPYVKQVAAAEEGVRLIKFADLYDNCTSVTYCLYSLGSKWAEGYFLPIVTPMIEALLPTEFATYPKAAERLKGMVRVSRRILLEEVARYKETGR